MKYYVVTPTHQYSIAAEIHLNRWTDSYITTKVVWEGPFDAVVSEEVQLSQKTCVFLRSLAVSHYVLLMHFSANATNKTYLEMSVRTMDQNFPLLQSAYWEAVLTLNHRENQAFFLALPGRVERVGIENRNKKSPTVIFILTRWIRSEARLHVHKTHLEISSCVENVRPKADKLKKVHDSNKLPFPNYTLTSRLYSIKYFQNQTYHFVKYIGCYCIFGCNAKLFSWTEAESICSKAGTILPQFLSRNEQENFVSILNIATELFLIEAIFIGLQANSSKCR